MNSRSIPEYIDGNSDQEWKSEQKISGDIKRQQKDKQDLNIRIDKSTDLNVIQNEYLYQN